MRCTLRKNQIWERCESKNNGTELDGKYRSKFKGSATLESICMCRSTMRKKRRFHRLLLLGSLFFFLCPTLFTYPLSLFLSLSLSLFASVNSRGFPMQFPEMTTKISIYHSLHTVVFYLFNKIISQRECQSCRRRLNEYGLKVLGGAIL